MLSTTQMIRKLEGMVDSKDLNEWENNFVKALVDRANSGDVTKLSDRQLEVMLRLHDKHFG
jgi:hypothetical protein